MIDHKREEAVWKRVMEHSEQAPPCCKIMKIEPLSAAKVMELLRKEQDDACTYEALASRIRGEAGRKLLVLAQQERCHRDRLKTIYYLLTGKKACPEKTKAPCIACTAEELRNRYAIETQSAQVYEELAKQAGSFGDVFRELALEEGRHAYEVLCILQSVL